MTTTRRYRGFVVGIFFIFIFLHQSDRLLINSLTNTIMTDLSITTEQWGYIMSGSFLVAGLLYPIWGYLYDRYARVKLLALASFIWGCTSWLSTLAHSFPTFLATRASTGIDDSSYPGLYSLIADYFGPTMRSKIYGILQLAMPLGYLAGMILALTVGSVIGWRNVFLITAGLGILLAIVIFFGVKEFPRGKSEPELANLESIGIYRFDRKIALGLFRKRSLLFLFAQGFAGTFPWNVITTWFLHYLETSRHYTETERMLTMGPAILILAGGYFVGGFLGDALFKKTNRGRLMVCLTGVLFGLVLLWLTMAVPIENRPLFFLLLCLTALFIPFSSPNIVSTVYDIALPEVRSTALSVQSFIEEAGTAVAPALAGFLAVRTSMHDSILWICTIAWLFCAIFLIGAVWFVPKDIETLRGQMKSRAEDLRPESA